MKVCAFSEDFLSLKNFSSAIDRLFNKKCVLGRASKPEEKEIFSNFYYNKHDVSKQLIKNIQGGIYRIEPCRAVPFRLTSQKCKISYVFSPQDQIVLEALSLVLNLHLEKYYTGVLYSYRKGIRWTEAVSKLSSCIKRSERMYFIKCDVSGYSENIPQDLNSLLSKELKETLFPKMPTSGDEHVWKLLSSFISPYLESKNGTPTKIQGLPTGTPICPAIYNFYLIKLDKLMSKDPDKMSYFRYSDDFVLASADPIFLKNNFEALEQELLIRGLSLSKEKTLHFYLTKDGQNSNQEGFLARQYINYLGLRLDYKGETCLKPSKRNLFLRDLRRRINSYSNSLEELRVDLRIQRIISFVNTLLMSTKDPSSLKYSEHLRKKITSRSFLIDLDYQIALITLRAIYRQKKCTPKLFRRLSYAALRGEYGLRSLTVERNKVKSAPT